MMMQPGSKTKLKDMTDEERKEYERNRKRHQRQNAKKTNAKKTNAKKVVGLKNNSGDNICFGNVAIQLLYSLPRFHLELSDTSLSSICVLKLKELFTEINEVSGNVRPTPYFHAMDIPLYIPYQQYDSHEFLTYILGQVYQDINKSLYIQSEISITFVYLCLWTYSLTSKC